MVPIGMGHNDKRIESLGGMTAATARAAGRQADIAVVTGLTETTVRRNLNDAHGKTLVRNVFVEHWPADNNEHELDSEELGEMTAAAARNDDRQADIAAVTGLTEATVRRRLNDVSHGKTLVRNLFEDDWPNDHEADIDALGDMTAADARTENRGVEIAEATNLTEATVRRRLNDAHGNTLVRNVFEDHWPNDEAGQGEGEGEDDEPESHNATGLQGRADHRKMQKSLVDLGSLRRLHVRTNYSIGAGFKPDVLWFRLNPSEHQNAAPIAAFEIEFGSAQAIAKSLASLKHAFDLGTQNLFLILPSNRVEGAKLRLRGAFHEIAESISVLPIENTIELSLVELADRLRF